jgi:deoxyribodipyrimidine photo-lyase
MIALDGFSASRAAGLARLADFVPRAGRAYAEGRNSDAGPGAPGAVSRLSPYVRHRLITEREVVGAVLGAHSFSAAEKFVAEVLWRTYWKGWLELRPGIWRRYCDERDAARERVKPGVLASAEAGTTGIDGFDDWARELVATGYLHNHARMWFASIWIFTLRLPWTLGADFFMRHLIDADAASNTLSWRWVAGLQTPGKTYLATSDNIARYTHGRFAPQGLAHTAVALTEAPVPPPRALPDLPTADPALPTLLLVTPDDLHPESLFASTRGFAGAVVTGNNAGGPLSRRFVAGAVADTVARVGTHFDCPTQSVQALDAEALIAAAAETGARQIVMPYAPIGPDADALKALLPHLDAAGLRVVPVRRGWDSAFWPHATKGFFAFKTKIPRLLAAEAPA